MALYCGIDLHSNNCWVSVFVEGQQVVKEKRIGNDLDLVLEFLEPFREEIEGIAVESTYNWYWLVDGLMDAGYQVHLTNTWAIKQYDRSFPLSGPAGCRLISRQHRRRGARLQPTRISAGPATPSATPATVPGVVVRATKRKNRA